ncbi:MAG: branched-chain amino acid ABC transporter permease [Candidatus Geothermarchaeales archaeon]
MWTETLLANKYKVAAYAAGVIALFLMPSILPTYGMGGVLLDLLSYTLVYGIVAIAVNLLLSYAGLLSFGHALYFGLGGYTVGWLSFNFGLFNIDYLMLFSVLVSLIAAAVFGALCVRHTAIYFMILTYSLQEIVHVVLHKVYYLWNIPTGGSEGIPILIPISRKYDTVLFGVKYAGPKWRIAFLHDAFYYYILIAFIFCVLAMWVIANSPLGKTLKAIKANTLRAEFIGIRVKLHRWIVFIISGTFAGIAGALWAPLAGYIDPHIFHWQFAGSFVFMAVIGGAGVFLGPLLGAFLYLLIRHILWGLTLYWAGIMGGIFVFFVLVFPRGILGEIIGFREKRPRRYDMILKILKEYVKPLFSHREKS